ncbi:metal-binding protein [Clostridium acetobutylicum]|nr:metal-binding protein [Clostridium acetobutylicum]
MVINEIMKYVESEYSIIKNTPCEVCGGSYEASEEGIGFINDEPYDICECSCSECGHERVFQFAAPFLVERPNEMLNKTLN